MTRTIWFVTHPDVLIDPAVPVPDWPLSARGVARVRTALDQPPGNGGFLFAVDPATRLLRHGWHPIDP